MRKIFVFGSNLAGRHGAGAANHALKHYGARYGQGQGLQGDSYAIPTKDHRISSMGLQKIKEYVDIFIDFARDHPEMEFQLTEIGCGLAGYKPFQIAPMFRQAPGNVIIPHDFIPFLMREAT